MKKTLKEIEGSEVKNSNILVVWNDCFTTLHVSKNEQRNRKQNNEKKYMVIKQMEKRFMHKFLYTIPVEPA